MRDRMPIILASGASIGVIGAYLIAGGASYEPLRAEDPCDPRPQQVLEQRGVLEGIVLSAIDGAACELGVGREELTVALGGDQQALQAFADRYEIDERELDFAVRAALVRAVDDADRRGALPGGSATALRFIAERLPIAAALDIFRALPGDPTPGDIVEAVRNVDERIGRASDGLRDFLDGLQLPDELRLPDDLKLPEGLPIPEDFPAPDQLPGFEDLKLPDL